MTPTSPGPAGQSLLLLCFLLSSPLKSAWTALMISGCPKRGTQESVMSTVGEGVCCSLKRAHHHNHGNTGSICRSNGSPECMSGAAQKLHKPGGPLPAPPPFPKRCLESMSWVPTSSPCPCRAPVPRGHLCCYSTKFTRGLPWAGCSLHISCGICAASREPEACPAF